MSPLPFKFSAFTVRQCDPYPSNPSSLTLQAAQGSVCSACTHTYKKTLMECQKFRVQTEARSVAIQRFGQAIPLGPGEQRDEADNLRLQAGIHQGPSTGHNGNGIIMSDMYAVLPHARVPAPASDAAAQRPQNNTAKELLSKARAGHFSSQSRTVSLNAFSKIHDHVQVYVQISTTILHKYLL